MALCNVFVERILPEIDHNHYFGIIQRKAIFWKICFWKNLPMGVCHTQGYIVQPPNLRFFGHSSLILSKYGGGVGNDATTLCKDPYHLFEINPNHLKLGKYARN